MTQANFSTGPVAVSRRVRDAFVAPAISHRSTEFSRLLAQTRTLLAGMMHANHVAIACGGGTHANEMIAQQIRRLPGRGLILVNGEFGERLCGLATRAALAFDTLHAPWGERIDLQSVRTKLDSGNRYQWLWCVATETSTGARFDISALQQIATERGVRLCIDCMSAIGVTPLNFRDVFLASASSGKGLASVAGLALVFARTLPTAPSKAECGIPASLDLALHLDEHAVPFTMPSSLLAALHASLTEIAPSINARFARIANDSAWLREALRHRGLHPLIDGVDAASGIITLALPTTIDAREIGVHIRNGGVDIGFESAYLRERNWIQIALMGQYSSTNLKRLPAQIARAAQMCAAHQATPTQSSLDHSPRALANLAFGE
jgi:aspartate aminotransferase-like enzyme